MDTTTLDFNTITLMVTIAGSWLTLVGLIIFQSSRLDTKIGDLDTRAGRLETKVTAMDTKVDALNTKVDALNTSVDRMGLDVADTRERLVRVEEHMDDHGRRLGELSAESKEQGRVLGEVRERLARVEGHLLPSGGFTLHGTPRPGADTGSAGDSGTEHREGREAG